MWRDTADCRGKVKTNASVLFCALFVQHLLLTPISKDKKVITTTTFFILPKIGFLYRLSMSSKNKTRTRQYVFDYQRFTEDISRILRNKAL